MKFELFGRLKKHNAPPAAPPMRKPPVEKVNEYAAAGMPEAEIIKTLKSAGYSFREIDAALNSALKSGVGTEAYNEDTSLQGSAPNAEMLEPLTLLPEENKIVAPQVFEGKDDGFDKINIEELEEVVNSIADEKMRVFKIDLEKSTNSIVGFAEKLNSVSTGLESMKSTRETTDADAEKRIGELHARIDEIEPKLLGLERAFKDIMPNLVDSIRELKEIIHGMQKTNASKKEETFEDSFLNDDSEIISKLK
ncbi:MAG: hypothetical protein KAJ91_03990 [Candidatus Aenigmarchaeota archaeon]|nr:hypothetical protein [Candidatus Aenigmarchaeota archaeon]